MVWCEDVMGIHSEFMFHGCHPRLRVAHHPFGFHRQSGLFQPEVLRQLLHLFHCWSFALLGDEQTRCEDLSHALPLLLLRLDEAQKPGKLLRHVHYLAVVPHSPGCLINLHQCLPRSIVVPTCLSHSTPSLMSCLGSATMGFEKVCCLCCQFAQTILHHLLHQRLEAYLRVIGDSCGGPGIQIIRGLLQLSQHGTISQCLRLPHHLLRLEGGRRAITPRVGLRFPRDVVEDGVIWTRHQLGEVFLLAGVVDLNHLLWRLPTHPASRLFMDLWLPGTQVFTLSSSSTILSTLHLCSFVLCHPRPDVLHLFRRRLLCLRLHPSEPPSTKKLQLDGRVCRASKGPLSAS